ncbi:MAG TPA: amidohydrolase family protein [Bryobacteraceae bacterium]|nr:amidohydrolase family protein [Bryobacteraceae bacterium]
MQRSGFSPSLNDYVEVRFTQVLDGVDSLIQPVPDNLYIAPGWIDLQVNGYAGVDYNSPSTSHEEIARSIHVLHSTGTTRLFPTVITGSRENMIGCLRNLSRAKASLDVGASMEAFHVEGPHISPDDGPRGAHPRQHVRPPDFDEYRRWQDATDGLVRLVTLAPEWPGATDYIQQVVRDGTVVSIGHTAASPEQIRDAVTAGATMSTHIGNGAHSVLPRHPNYLWEQLAEDRLAAGFIVDGIHIGAAFLKVALRAKTVARSVLVTDASMPALATPGPYRLGEVDVELTPGGRVVLLGGTRLAGSSLRMDYAIANLMRMTGVGLNEAITMATRNPARVGRIGGRQRGLAAGDRADLVVFEYDKTAGKLSLLETIVSGRTVWSRDSTSA